MAASCGASGGEHLQLQVPLPLISVHQTTASAQAVARDAPENTNADSNTNTKQGCFFGKYSYFEENHCCLILCMRTGPKPDMRGIPPQKADANSKYHKYIPPLTSLFQGKVTHLTDRYMVPVLAFSQKAAL